MGASGAGVLRSNRAGLCSWKGDVMEDLLQFIADLNPRASYPPDEVDDEPHVVIPQSTWEAIVDDARAALSAVEEDRDDH